jgi:murein DD-endopeptidase MepM/ murein hydrolase activator NlpD
VHGGRHRFVAGTGPLVCLVLLTGAAGCFDGCGGGADAPGEPPPPTDPPSEAEEEGVADAGPAAPDVFVEHTVEEGQTLWDIAHSYGVSVSDVMTASELSPNDVRKLRPGHVLTIPGAEAAVEVLSASERARRLRESLPEPDDGAYHFLAEGETLWDLARLYDTSMDDIMARNGFSDADARALRSGKPVLIPGISKDDIQKTEPRKRRGVTHTLAYGETVWDLANAFQVSVGEIMSANGLSSDQVTALREGTRLFIPGVTRDRSTGKVRRTRSAHQQRAMAKAKLLGLGTRRTASRLLGGRVEQRWIRAAGQPVDRLPGTLRWPVTNGWFTRGYGSGMQGYHQAVDIMGEVGWNVRAAARGIVAYSGDEVRGYGNLVLVVHPGGWVTMYAHNSVNFVVAGEHVPRGGILAEVGSTGISRGPHVHFELIHAGRNCDPAPLFRPGIKHRSGKVVRAKQVEWRDPSSQPRTVDCARRRRHPKSRWVIHEDPEG